MKPADFQSVFDAFLADSLYLSPSTRKNMAVAVRSLLEFCGRQTVTGGRVTDWTLSLKREGYMLSTITVHRAAIAQICRWGIAKGEMTAQLVERIRSLPAHRPKPSERMITREEYARLLDYSYPEEFSWWPEMIRLGWETGLRLCDCALLLKSSVDPVERALHVTPIKTQRHGQTADLPVSTELLSLLVGRMDDGLGIYIWPMAAWYAEQQGTGALSTQFRKWGVACGLKCPQFHAFRHARVTRMIEAGESLGMVRAITGHSLACLQRYADHVSLDAKRAAVARVDSLSACSPGGNQ